MEKKLKLKKKSFIYFVGLKLYALN